MSAADDGAPQQATETRRPHWLGSLRTKTLALLCGSALIATSTGVALIWSIRTADFYIERTNLSQRQLEYLLLLSGRFSNYGMVAQEAMRPGGDSAQLANAEREVGSVFTLLDDIVEQQVTLLRSDEEKNAEATEGLAVARMRAMFQNLDRQMTALQERRLPPEEAQDMARRALDVFGLGVSPVLSQSVEDDRSEARVGRANVAALKARATLVAMLLIASALGLAAFLYLGPVRSILRRLSETISGAGAIAAGRLDTRLTPRGQDELTLLMASFNRMAANLSTREGELVRAQDELHTIVAQRTAELTDANRKLAQVDADRRRFFADVSHELRTPLTVILGEAEITLRQGDQLPAAGRRSMETIQARAKRLNRRVEDLLRLARSESGRVELNVARIEAGAVLAEAVEDVQSLARRKGMTIALDRGPGMLSVRGDRDWLRQVAGGIIANALKYAPEGSEVAVAARLDGRSALLLCTDRGPGIPPEEQPLVFDRFFRGKPHDGMAEPGHGVGLALAKWVIEEHKGAIELVSPAFPGDTAHPGTRIVIRLGLADADDEASHSRTAVL